MLKIKGTDITFNRGDSIYLNITVYDENGAEYELQEGDALYYSVKAKLKDKNYAIPPKKLEKTLLSILPEDTYDLDFGEYVYDVQLITANGRSSTIIKPSAFIIEPTVTAYGDR